MTPEGEAIVQRWAMSATALGLLAVGVGALVGWRKGLTPGLVVGLLGTALPWAAAAIRAVSEGAGIVAYAVAGFALVPSAAAGVVLSFHFDDPKRAAAGPSFPRWSMQLAGGVLLLAFAPAVLAGPLGLDDASSAGWTLLSVASVSGLLGIVVLGARLPRALWFTILATAVCLAYFGGLALQIAAIPVASSP